MTTIDSLTDEFILALKAMPKVVDNPRAREMAKAKHIEKNFDVISIDREHRFRLITRQSTLIAASFTAGLLWLPPGNASIVLTRYNGSDHPHRNPLEGSEFDPECHIHLATQRYIIANRKSEHYAEPTDRYSTLDGALYCLTTDWNIEGLSKSKSVRQLGFDV